MKAAEFERLGDRVRMERSYGEAVIWRAEHQADSRETALAWLLAEPPPPLTSPSIYTAEPDGDFRRVAPEIAERVLISALQYDLAYGSEVMLAPRATELARTLMAVVGDPATWWTNGGLALWREPDRDDVADKVRDPSWNPFSEATFDTGVIGVSDTCLMVAWFLDED